MVYIKNGLKKTLLKKPVIQKKKRPKSPKNSSVLPAVVHHGLRGVKGGRQGRFLFFFFYCNLSYLWLQPGHVWHVES